MLGFRRILVPTDLSPSAGAAFEAAHYLAEHFTSEIHVLHVEVEGGPLGAFTRWFGGEPDSIAAEEHDRRVVEALEDLNRRYASSQVVRRTGRRAAEEIVTYAGEWGADLIVLGTHGHRSLDHPALGGTAGDVVRNTSVPIMTVRVGGDGQQAPISFRHILVAVDFAEHSTSVVRNAKHLAALLGATVSLLFVAEQLHVPLFSDTGLMTVTTLKLDEEIVARTDEALRQLDRDTGKPADGTQYVVRQGNPARQILSVADESQVDLIVVGRRGHTIHDGVLLGSVTEHVIRKSRRPVLTITAEP